MAKTAHVRYRRKNRFGILLAITGALALIGCFVMHLTVNVNPIIEILTSEEVKNRTTIVMNESLKSVMGGQITYGDIVDIDRDGDGNVNSLSVNTVLVNDVARDITIVALSKLKKIGVIAVEIPVGTLSGITFLGGLGPTVTVNCIPAVSVNVSFKSTFRSVGINNTLHSIVMHTDSSVNIVMPGLTKSVDFQTEVPLVNTVIVGRIPNTYLQFGALDEMLNLIP